MLDSISEKASLSPAQTEWLQRPDNKDQIPFILDIWEEDYNCSPELANLSLHIAIDAWRLGFFEGWDEVILDHILFEKLPEEDRQYAEALKQHLQLQMLLQKEENGEKSSCHRFFEACSATLPNGFELQVMDTVEGITIYNQTDRGIYLFQKKWPDGLLVFLSTHEGEDIPESASLVIS
jgi:hypothetical protein